MATQTPGYKLHSPEIGERFQDFYNACDEQGAPDTKTRELLMVALACISRCPHCTEEHIRAALEVGATKDEVAEALLIALYWAKQVYERHFCSDLARIS